jgi:hypothetical protein
MRISKGPIVHYTALLPALALLGTMLVGYVYLFSSDKGRRRRAWRLLSILLRRRG